MICNRGKRSASESASVVIQPLFAVMRGWLLHQIAGTRKASSNWWRSHAKKGHSAHRCLVLANGAPQSLHCGEKPGRCEWRVGEPTAPARQRRRRAASAKVRLRRQHQVRRFAVLTTHAHCLQAPHSGNQPQSMLATRCISLEGTCHATRDTGMLNSLQDARIVVSRGTKQDGPRGGIASKQESKAVSMCT